MVGLFDTIISVSKDAGIFGFYLPFLVAFVLIYGLLNRAQIFGKERPAGALNAVIAFAIAFYVMGFTDAGMTVGKFLGTFFANSTIAIIGFIVVMMALAVFESIGATKIETVGYDEKGRPIRAPTPVVRFGRIGATFIILILIGIFIYSGGLTIFGIKQISLGLIGGTAFTSQDILIIVFIILTVVIIGFITRGTKEKAGPGP